MPGTSLKRHGLQVCPQRRLGTAGELQPPVLVAPVFAALQAGGDAHPRRLRVDGDLPAVEQRVQVRAQQDAVRCAVGVRAAVRTDVGGLEDMRHRAAAYRAASPVRPEDGVPESLLAKALPDLPFGDFPDILLV